jgi:D-xylose transport system ATP-binding protein
MLGDPKLVILDEPTAALGVAQTRQVLDLIRTLRDHDVAVLVISHNLVDVFDVSDRIIVLRLGRRFATFRTKETTTEQVVAAITGVGRTDVEQANGAETA